jgi:DNA gyrase/topoisomerase IV subunit A
VPDIVIKKTTKECILINIAIPSERNTFVNVTEKLLKYKDLEIEINTMWGVKTTRKPVVIETLEQVKNTLTKSQDTFTKSRKCSSREQRMYTHTTKNAVNQLESTNYPLAP